MALQFDQLSQYFDAQQERILEELKQFLQIPSVSTDPEYAPECEAAAHWLLVHLGKLDFQAKLLQTPGKPVVYGEKQGKPGAPIVIFYGHYDVQPADPLELWESPPFEPTLREGRLYARGAQDNKGQLFYVLKALEYLITEKLLDCTVRVFIEGEEECGSRGIGKSLHEWTELAGDILLVCDTGSRGKDICAITTGLRGIAGLTVRVVGPNKDLHSGVHGGIAPNPVLGLAQLLATLHTTQGRIAVEGFYDDIPPAEPEDIALAESVDIPEAWYQQLTGVLPVGGEKGKSFAVRRGFEPTIEVNGISGGYSGPGMKTIIPSSAFAKISTRLVAGQDPDTALKKIEAHFKEHAPEGIKVEITEREIGGPGLRVSSKSPLIQKARSVLQSLPVGELEFMWEGASIPIVASLAQKAQAEPLLIGFGLEEDNIHAPNESFSLEQFRKGFLAVATLLQSFSDKAL